MIFEDETAWKALHDTYEENEDGELEEQFKGCDECDGTVRTNGSEAICDSCGLDHGDTTQQSPTKHNTAYGGSHDTNPRGNVDVSASVKHRPGPRACVEHDGRVRPVGGWHYPYLSVEFGKEYCVDSYDDVTDGLWVPHLRS